MENDLDGWRAFVRENPAMTADRISVIEERNGMNNDAVAGPWGKQNSPSASAPGPQLKTPLSRPADDQVQTQNEVQR